MIEAFWIPLLPPYLIGLGLSWAIEALLTPRPVAPWRRPGAAVAVHVGVWTLAFALELALFRRPYFAVANVLAIELLIVLVSNTKFRALREPFVYADFEYFLDAIKHPRLYLPFFGVWRALAAGSGYLLILWAGLALEDSVMAGASIWLLSFLWLAEESSFDRISPIVPFLLHVFAIGIIGAVIGWQGGRRLKWSNEEPAVDLIELGLAPYLWLYSAEEKKPIQKSLFVESPFHSNEENNGKPGEQPHLLVVQSESFFDVRRQYPQINREILTNFDSLKADAEMHGLVKVKSWGANTVRTEFGFLSGLPASKLGVHRFNPYRKLASQSVPTIATYLRSRGYRTICVHPYHGQFYRRAKVIPLLGFDEFVDITEFADAERQGVYVGDIALGDYVSGLLNAAKVPLFIHVITMENHGPLHWESVSADDFACLSNGSLPLECKDLIAYARHLRNADEMFKRLGESLQASERPGAMCLYGDHVPLMVQVYDQLGYASGDTDYLIWRTGLAEAAGLTCDLEIHELAGHFLRRAGIAA
ncbi:LTA synthase family protein [Alcaligenaceae bacterium C4P045]|nr:LTA synthase family protein [Alcaligenaceae bacterium C4P045]